MLDLNLGDGFYDLCVNVTEENLNNLENILLRLYEMGFRTVALNQNVNQNDLPTKKRKKGEETSLRLLPEPIDVDKFSKLKGKLRIFNRLTFVFYDPDKTHSINHSKTLKKYNLYAVIPKTAAALQYSCTQLNADIISMDFDNQSSNSTAIKLNRKLYQQSVARDMFFEIQYSHILNASSRGHVIQYAHSLYTYNKSKNVILSSGAENIQHIRNPYDIANLGIILGLNEARAKAALLWQCKTVILKAERRRFGKAIFGIESAVKNADENEDESS